MARPAAALESLLRSALEAVGYELVGSEFSRQAKHSHLRVYIGQEAGITADDCAKASRQIASVFDVEDPIEGFYTLEVSSPGLDRPLYSKEDYRRFLGQMIKLRLRVPCENQRNFSGILLELSDEDKVSLQTEQGPKDFVFTNIEKANLVPNLKK